jgi:hypothetical protein
MDAPANYKQVLDHFKAAPADVQASFPAFLDLAQKYPWDVSVSYVFSRVEAVKHVTIYCGIVKLHWTDADLTRDLVEKDHMSRGRFKDLFKTVFGTPIKKELLDQLAEGETIRDKVAHGKEWSPAEVRRALKHTFDFATGFNAFVEETAGFRPFGDLRGFKGRRESLPKETTKWVLRGMGIPSKVAE